MTTSRLSKCSNLLQLPRLPGRTMCGYLASFTSLMFSSLTLRYWSTECRTPVMHKSFFSSTVTCR